MSETRQYIYHTLSSFNIRYVLLLNPLCSTRPNGLVKHNGFRSSIYLMLNSEGCDKYIISAPDVEIRAYLYYSLFNMQLLQ